MQSDQPQPSIATPTGVARDHLSPLGFTYWQDGNFWLGYLDEFPDYVTLGESMVDLEDHLLSLYEDLAGGEIPPNDREQAAAERRIAQEENR